QKGRDHEKDTEVEEVLAKVGGTLRCRESLSPDLAYRQSERFRIDRGAQRCAHLRDRRCRRLSGRRGYANRRERAVARTPERAGGLEIDERLWRRAIPIPVVFVDWPHAAEIERKGRVPFADARGVADAWIS